MRHRSGASRGGRRVAIKVIHPRHASDPEFRRRFAREVATAFIGGPSLADTIAEHGAQSEAGVRELGAALAEGLAAIHACGLIHRDLKPGHPASGTSFDGCAGPAARQAPTRSASIELATG